MSEFTKSKAMELPRYVVVGHDVLPETAEICHTLRIGRKVLVVCDENTWDIAGSKVAEYMEVLGFIVDTSFISEADRETIENVKDEIKEKSIDIILGIGGGRPIDVAKCASYERRRSFVSIPTSASHDGIISANASLMENGRKTSIQAQTPIALIADTTIISSAPHRLLAAGCGDIISNITAVKDWELARDVKGEGFSTSASLLAELVAKTMMDTASSIVPGKERSAWQVVKALVSSGMAMTIAGSSRPASGSEHLFSHALDMSAQKPALHGEQCSLGTIMMAKHQGGDWERVRDALKKVGAPVTAKEVGLKDEEIINALVMAKDIKKDRFTILTHKPLDNDSAEELARETGVI